MNNIEKSIRTGLALLAVGTAINGVGVRPSLNGETQVSKAGHSDLSPVSSLKNELSKMFEVQTAFAEGLTKPTTIKNSKGQMAAFAKFDQPGRAYIFTSQDGLELFNDVEGQDAPAGAVYKGPVKLIMVANEDHLTKGVRTAGCGATLSIDVIDNVGGSSYGDYVTNAANILDREAQQIAPLERRNYSLIRVILPGRDDSGRESAPDEIVGSFQIPNQPEPQGCAAPLVPVSVPVFVPAISQPGQPAPVGSCVNLEVPLGTASGNGATLNAYTVTREVIVHGDIKINGEFRADNSGATGLIQRVHATPSNPALIEVANPAWGGDVAAFCNPADMDANVAQGVAHLQNKGMRADVLNWPGPNQLGGLVSPATAPAYNPAVVNSGIVETNLYPGMGWTVNYNDLANGRFTIVAGDGVLIDSQGNKFNILSGNPRVGTMVVFSGIGSESLPWGGHVWSGISKGALKSYVENINNQIRVGGCSNGCDGANTYLWDGSNVNFLTPYMLDNLIR